MQNLSLPDAENGRLQRFTVRGLYESGTADGSLVQYGKGLDEGELSLLELGTSRLIKVRYKPKAFLRTSQDRKFANFTAPRNSSERWRINGLKLRKNTFCVNLHSDGNELLASDRKQYCGRIPVSRFSQALRDLTGRDMSETENQVLICTLTPQMYRSFIGDLANCDRLGAQGFDALLLQQTLIETLAGAVAFSYQVDFATYSGNHSRAKLVKKARETLEAGKPGQVSIAELCRVTGVSAPSLIAAFKDVTGESPSRFFAMQRAARVREKILRSENLRGAIKSAALSEGFMELGRFSAFYRGIYGEPPSETLRRLAPKVR